MTPPEASQPEVTPAAPTPKWRDPNTLWTVLLVLIGSAAAWYLMVQLASVLRPLLVAVFLAYVLMPYHSRLRKRVGTPASIGLLVGSTAAVLVLLAFITYASILDLEANAPTLEKRARELFAQAEQLVTENAPWLVPAGQGQSTQDRVNEQIGHVARPVLDFATGAVMEACLVALYL